MHPTRNNLPESTRSTMVQLLNQRLAVSIDLQLQAKQAHWNVRGPHFYSLHKLFDEVVEQAIEFTDTIAERVAAWGESPRGHSQPLDPARAFRPIRWRSRTVAITWTPFPRRWRRSASTCAPRSTWPHPPAMPTRQTSSPRSRERPTSCSGSSRPTSTPNGERGGVARGMRKPHVTTTGMTLRRA